VGPQDIAAVAAATARYSAEVTDPRAGLLTVFATTPYFVSGTHFIDTSSLVVITTVL
jgi:hypothetical protein